MAVENDPRLVAHYDDKYCGEAQRAAVPVRIVARPRDRYEAAVAAALRDSGGRYLEIGAGSGDTLLTLLPHYDQLVATELSPVRAARMRDIFRDRAEKLTILCSDIEREGLPYPDEYFDTAAMVAVVEHLVDPIRALVELRRVLRPGGRLILDTPNLAKWTRRIKLLFGYFPSTASLDEGLLCYGGGGPTDLYDEGHLHYFTFRSLSRLCTERAGFKRIERIGYGNSPLNRFFPSIFSEIFIKATK
jgi:SAM-dependent methyltransferase